MRVDAPMIADRARHTVQRAVEKATPGGRPYRKAEVELVVKLVMSGYRIDDAWRYQIAFQWAKENPV